MENIMNKIKLNKKMITIGVSVTLGILVALLAVFITFGIKATESALYHANLTKNDVSYIRFDFEFDDFLPEYDVKWNIGMREYEYTVHAITGDLLGMDID
ncbi:MAG: hypothetical protein R3Y12_08050 [Clostridia bacterium]